MTGGSDGLGPGGGRHRGRFTGNAKPLAAVLTGIAALLLAIAGTVTLVCSNPDGDPASAMTTTAVGVLDGSSSTAGLPAGPGSALTPTPTSGGPTSTAATSTSTPGTPSTLSTPTSGSSPAPTGPISGTASTTGAATPTTRPSVAPPPTPQWEGDIQVDSAGYSLATVPPTPDQSGDPDISATFDGSFFASFGAAQWTDTAPPSPEACAALIEARGTAYVTGVPGDVYCVRVAHSAAAPGSQYAVVRIVAQGRDAGNLPYVLVHAVVWPGR